MDLKTYIEKNWTIAQTSTQGAIRLWDQFADGQRGLPPPTPETSRALKIVTEQQMFDDASDILDLGCGGGRFALWFGRRCRSVVGTDLSEKMIAICRDTAEREGLGNVSFVQADWHRVDLKDHNWQRAFDLVFCNTSPAVQSVETFEALCDASRKWCFMSKPTHRAEPITKFLLGELNMGDIHRPFDLDMIYAYDWLYLKGYLPMVDYETLVWDRSRPLADAVTYYTNWLETNYALTEKQKPLVRPALEKIAVNGMIREQETTVISYLFWRVD